MNGTKPVWQSKTVILAAIGLVLAAFGIDIEDPTAADSIESLAVGILSVCQILTRVAATKRLTW
jgi:hypothetical protein